MIDDLLDLTRIGRDGSACATRSWTPTPRCGPPWSRARPGSRPSGWRSCWVSGPGGTTSGRTPCGCSRCSGTSLDNAVKFTPEGGRITLRTDGDESGRLAVTVEDTGVGIEPEALGKVFDPFEQAGRTVTRGHGGLGLGLSIARTLVEAHGGRLTAASGGRGAAFTLANSTGLQVRDF